MIKQFIAASGAAVFSLLAPAQARVETRTGDLMRLLQTYGVVVKTNPPDNCGGSMGRFKLASKPIMEICYDGNGPTAADHDTVRHETWHYLQWCKNPNTVGLIPLHKDRGQYISFVQNALSDHAIERINLSYPQHVRAVEYEAFAAANTYTAQTLMAMVRKHCTPV